MTVYTNGKAIPVPQLDILTLLFDSEHCRANEDTPIYAEARDPARTITKARARQLTTHFAHFLRKEYSVGKAGPGKDIVVAVSTGQSALACLFYGVVAAGGVYSAASSASTPADLARQIKDGPGRVLVCSRDLSKLAQSAAELAGLPKRNIVVLESQFDIRLASADGALQCDFTSGLDWERITDPDELENSRVCILYSSGTTGLPKGVLISHSNMVSEVFIPSAVNRPVHDEWERQGNGFPKRTLGHLPTAHIAGVQSYFVNCFYDGGIVFWMPSFDFEKFVQYCSSLEITGFFTVPPIYMAIAKHPLVKDQFRFMRQAVTGAAPLSQALQESASLKLAGTPVTQTWGLSETTGAVTHTPPGRTDTMGSLSPLLPNVQLRLVDESGNDVAMGQPGEALLKGPMVTKGYHNNPEANKSAFTSDGWFRTGDILRIEGDLLYIVDRMKELIKYKGLQVAPAELEGLLASHPSVADAAVIGVPLEETEVPRAYVVLAPAAQGKVSAADLVAFVKQNVSGYKQLRGGVVFLDAIPRSPSGKILRKDLRAMLKHELERQAKL